MDICIGCVNFVKSAVFVVGIAVHLLRHLSILARSACAMTATNGVKVVCFGARRRGRVGGECRFRRAGWGVLLPNTVSFGIRVGVENWQTDGCNSLLMLDTLVVYGEEYLLMLGKRFQVGRRTAGIGREIARVAVR